MEAVLDVDDLTAESRLLRGASYEGLRRLAGRPAEPAEPGLPIEPARSEPLAEIPPSAAVRLEEILESLPELLREWLRLAVERNLRVPPLSLPDLLEYARTDPDPDLRELMLCVGGERITWLARLNPEWQFAAHVDPQQQLAFALPADRAVALRHVRRQHPARGRQVLADVWASERGDARAKLLGALEVGLSADDEPVLGQALLDSRRDVRETALHLIREIPDSRFGERWTARARQIIVLKDTPSGARVDINEPGEVVPDWEADGLDPRPPKGVGRTAWLLQQIISLTPPSIWPDQALTALDHTDWRVTLLAGIAEAARAYRDNRWCENLLMLWASGANRQDNPPFEPGALFAALDASRAEDVLRRVMELNPILGAKLAGARSDRWSLEFSHFVIQYLPQWIARPQFPVISLIREATKLLDPRVAPEATRLLDVDIEPMWARPSVDRLVDMLDYRLAMREELAV